MIESCALSQFVLRAIVCLSGPAQFCRAHALVRGLARIGPSSRPFACNPLGDLFPGCLYLKSPHSSVERLLALQGSHIYLVELVGHPLISYIYCRRLVLLSLRRPCCFRSLCRLTSKTSLTFRIPLSHSCLFGTVLLAQRGAWHAACASACTFVRMSGFEVQHVIPALCIRMLPLLSLHPSLGLSRLLAFEAGVLLPS